jgi:hypothetical protein
MPQWSQWAIDYAAGFDVDPVTKCAVPRKIGCHVATLEECDAFLKHRGLW